jgi:hypothetical protein
MSWILIVALVIIAVVVLAVLKGKGSGTGTIDVPYQSAKALFSPAERSFLGVLDQAVGPEHRVFGKVRVADLATVKPGLSNAARQGALNRIAAKHVDFIVCRTSDLVVVCAVELNDKSHSGQRAQARDDLLAKVCAVIGLPLFIVQAKQAYSVQELRAEFLTAISPSRDAKATATI